MSATTRLQQSTSLGTTLAQAPTPLPKPRGVRPGAVQPVRLGVPASLVASLRPPVKPLPTEPVDISPEDKILGQLMVGAFDDMFGSPEARAIMPGPVFDLPKTTFWDKLTSALQPPEPNYPHELFTSEQIRQPQDVTPTTPTLGYTPEVADQPSAKTLTRPTLLSGLQPPTRDVAQEEKNRNSATAIATALPLIAALFGGDLGSAMRSTPGNLAAALQGSRVGADSDFAKAVQTWQLGQSAIDTENQLRQTNFGNEAAIASQETRDATQASLANARNINADVAQRREARLTNGVKIRQSENDRQAFIKGLDYLSRLKDDTQRTAALSDPNLLASFGFDELSDTEAATLAHLSRPIPNTMPPETRSLLTQLRTVYDQWINPLVPQSDKPRIYNDMQRLLSALGSPIAAPGSEPIVPMGQTVTQQKASDIAAAYLELARKKNAEDLLRSKQYRTHLATNDKLAGQMKDKDLLTMINAVEDDIAAAQKNDAKDPLTLLVQESVKGTLPPDQKARVDQWQADRDQHIAFLKETKRELLRRRAALKTQGFVGNSTTITETTSSTTSSITTSGQRTSGFTPPPLPVPGTGSQPKSAKPAGQASRQTDPHRAISTPKRTPAAAKTGAGLPTALVSTPVLGGVSSGIGSVSGLVVGASTPNGQATSKVMRPKAATTQRPKPKTTPRPTPRSGSVRTPDGYTIQVGP